MRLVFDTETNGLLDRPDLRVHCGVAIDVDTGEEFLARPDDLVGFYELLSRADELIGQNITGFDLPLIEKVYPRWKRTNRIYDTLVVSRARYTSDMLERTAKWRNSAGKTEAERDALFPKKLLNPRGIHGIKAWGYRLGDLKGDLLEREGAQEEFSEELLEYCLQDTRITVKLWRRLQQPDASPPGSLRPAPSYESMVVESRVAYFLEEQKRHGVGFDREAAEKLQATLAARRELLGRELRERYFRPWYSAALTKGDHDPAIPTRTGDASYKIPTRTYKVPHPHPLAGRTAGAAFTPIELVEFNPASRQQIADRLQKLYGWQPAKFSRKTGLPEVSEETMAGLEYPCIPLLMEYLLVDKRLGQLAEGNEAWLKHVTPAGLIHGTVMPTGARTARAAHSKPNLGQVPKVKTYPKGHPLAKQPVPGLAGGYGLECRGMFRPTRPGLVMIGADASGLQLRCLAHRLALWDGGAYAEELLKGDPHEAWRQVTGVYFRDNQKTVTYAFLFGAMDPKLGRERILDWRQAYQQGVTKVKPPPIESARDLGADTRASLLTRVPGLDDLIKGCKEAHRRGYVLGLDGRIVPCNTEHGVLNDVLQSDEAVIMKHAMCVFHDELAPREGLVRGRDYSQLLFVHDEIQSQAVPECAQVVGTLVVAAIKEAGERLKFRCPLDGEFKVGNNWAETH